MPAAPKEYLVNALKTVDRCDRSLRKGKTDACPDTSMEEKLMKLATKATGTLTSKCTNSDVNALRALGFGGSCGTAATVNSLATCQQGDHDALLLDLTTTPWP